VDEQRPVGRWGSDELGLDPRTRAFALAHLGPASPAPAPRPRTPRPTRVGADRWQALFPGIDIRLDDETRLRHSRGMSYLDLLFWRTAAGNGGVPAVDAVAFPADHEQALTLVQTCSREGIACVPVGGGTSVTGGITLAGEESTDAHQTPVLAISLTRMDALVAFDAESAIATVQAGMTGPALEAALDGYTLGHFPQSWERASIGGFIAARSSGQSSGGYGRIEDMLIGAELATPVGSWRVGGYPAASRGPDLRQLVLGSEGTLGIITSAEVRVRPAPSIREYAAALVPSPAGGFDPGIDIARTLTRSALRPTVLRVCDPSETDALLTMSAPTGLVGRAFDAYVRMRRARPGCLVILGWEGTDPATVAAARAFARGTLGDAGGVWLGGGPGRSWERGRFHGPYLRDQLMDVGYLVETFETVIRWSQLPRLHRELTSVAREAIGPRSYVMAHISHTYDTAASVYFTVLAGGWSDPHDAAGRWQDAKARITESIVAGGGGLSHHHGVGRDHAGFLGDQIGPIGMQAMAAVKASLDPANIMNPGALLGGDRE